MGFKSLLVALILTLFLGLISPLIALFALMIIGTIIQWLTSTAVYIAPIISLPILSITGIILTYGFYSISPKYLTELKTSTVKKLFFSALYLISYAVIMLLTIIATKAIT